MRAASAALAVVAGSLTFATAGAGSASASVTDCGQVLGPIQSIKVGSRTIGQFYLAWNSCSKQAYTEVNLWNTNYVNGNWHGGLIDVKSSSHYNSNTDSPKPNVGTWWWDSGYIPVTGVSNTRLYHGNWNFTAGGHSCSGQTPTWNFSNGSYSTDGTYSHCG
ncbi:hypothetical protein [Streptomyces morookaense]|uniref:Uncharacterized protein n=1 Tax=Streptomyces morookaense TaxID=1970 RepID=A0A7Y7B0T4_STRMO|nr:hypothetical protein [Streptomyces morookaense]NVK76556.1 hypothetical protein [Streptomyces morookaense]